MALATGDYEAEPALNHSVKRVLDTLLPFLSSHAHEDAMPIRAIAVEQFIDPDDASEETVVIQRVDASPQAALDYWDRLGAAVEDWSQCLPNNLKRVLAEQIAIEVRW